MNGMLFSRLVQILDKEQYDARRKIFVVIDELPTLAGDSPCPGLTDMFLRLRSRGVVVLVTYQVAESVVRLYGQLGASEIFQQCQNVLFGLQPATARDGIRGWSQVAVPRPLQAVQKEFHFGPKLVNREIPKTSRSIPEYIERDSSEQRMKALTREERVDLGLPALRIRAKPKN